MNKWFEIKAMAEDAEVLIFDEIGGWGIQAQAFADAWPKSAKKVVVKINSPGGSVTDGYAVYNTIMEARKNQIVNTRIEGLAASMASIVALAGQTVEMSENSLMMVHNPWGVSMGDSAEMRKTADLLDKMTGQLADIYKAKTGMKDEDVKNLMNNETWLTAQEALEMKFADKIVNTMSAKLAALVPQSFIDKLNKDGRLLAAMAKAEAVETPAIVEPVKVEPAAEQTKTEPVVIVDLSAELEQSQAALAASKSEADKLKADLAAMTIERDAMKAKFEKAFSVPQNKAKGEPAKPQATINRL